MGVRFDSEQQRFVFDFEHDGRGDIVSLTGEGYQVEAFGKCFYYGYEFGDEVDGNVRSAFIKYVKFTERLQDDPNLTQFIQKAVNNLNSRINLYDYDLVVMPQSSSRVNNYMLRYIYRFEQPKLRHYEGRRGTMPDDTRAECAGHRRRDHQRFHVRRGAAHAAYPERGQPHQHLQSHWPSRPHGRRYHLRDTPKVHNSSLV